MSKLNMTEAFDKYGAKLVNPQWAVSALIKEESELVVSCWYHYFGSFEKSLRYQDKLSRWHGSGNNLLRKHLTHAHENGLPIRVVIVTVSPKDRDIIDNGMDASGVKKTFSVRPDLVGLVASFDGDEFIIDFTRDEKSPSK